MGSQKPLAAVQHRGIDRRVGYDGLTPLDAASRSEADELVCRLRRQGATSAPK
jgi:hypothetical protein